MSNISEMQAFFGPQSSWPVFRAVSERQDLDFPAIMTPERDEEGSPFVGYMRPNPAKDFYMEISSTEKNADEWIVTTTNGRSALRRLPQDQATAFVEWLREEGINVD